MKQRRWANRWRLIMRRTLRIVWHSILHADDPPHRIALGVALGVFVALTPTLGLQMLIVVYLAWLLNANKVLGLPIVWITNPLTVVPIYFPQYWVGAKLLGHTLEWEDWSSLGEDHGGWLANMKHFWGFATDIAVPLWVGSLIVATVFGVGTYLVMRQVVTRIRTSRWAKVPGPPDDGPAQSPPSQGIAP